MPCCLKGEHFDNADLTGTRVVRVDPTIDFSWGTAVPIAGIGADTFSVRWTGNIVVPSITKQIMPATRLIPAPWNGLKGTLSSSQGTDASKDSRHWRV